MLWGPKKHPTFPTLLGLKVTAHLENREILRIILTAAVQEQSAHRAEVGEQVSWPGKLYR